MDTMGNDATALFHFSDPTAVSMQGGEPYTSQTPQGYPAAASWADILREIDTYDNGPVSSDPCWFIDGPDGTSSHGVTDHIHDLLRLGDDEFLGLDQLGLFPDPQLENGPSAAPESSGGDPLDEWLDLVASPAVQLAQDPQDHIAAPDAAVSYPGGSAVLDGDICSTPLPSTQTPQPDPDADVLLTGYQYTSHLPSSCAPQTSGEHAAAVADDNRQAQQQKAPSRKRAARDSRGPTKGGAAARDKKQRKQVQETVISYDDYEDDEEDGDGDDDATRTPAVAAGSQLNCKNLVSERNRRKRLSQQLLALRALVPNITKMDKRSVLVDALSYLKGIHEETAKIQAELAREQQLQEQAARPSAIPAGDGPGQSHEDHHRGHRWQVNDNNGDPDRPALPPGSGRMANAAHVLEVDVERMEDRRFVVKVTCAGSTGAAGKVLRAIETLGFDTTYAAVEQLRPRHYLTTTFVRVKKHGRMTESKLKDCIITAASRSGNLTLPENL